MINLGKLNNMMCFIILQGFSPLYDHVDSRWSKDHMSQKVNLWIKLFCTVQGNVGHV